MKTKNCDLPIVVLIIYPSFNSLSAESVVEHFNTIYFTSFSIPLQQA